ncbi:hypothetical protein IV454_23720 [Massilia antarctica]|uniref:Uncharacterized protein n=1 Tax=Massilia antarctica TaxID=2765360 RepID=A0AA49A6U4_9BURK|nr:hypothetical protein [Massilia antarctica]QPI48511.1 hypothetical protein IV454_23720 [Massilia antarctica]
METSVEIIAKKMWHRGDHITGRDIFDVALISGREPDALMVAGKFMARHADAILQQLDNRSEALKMQFEAIDALHFHPTFDTACLTLRTMLQAIRVEQGSHGRDADDMSVKDT